MTKIKTFFYRTICGFFLGISTVAPGFSGSIMAIAMGVYQELVRIMSNPLQELRKNFRFLLPIVVGALLSGILFVRVFNYFFGRHEKVILLLFVGLIAGNLPMIYKEAKSHPFAKRYLVGGVISFLIALGMGLLAIGVEHTAGSGEAVSFIEVALSGFVIGAVALVPGMSISAVLMMLGVYGELIMMAGAILSRDFSYLPHLLGVALCAVLGVVFASRGIKRFFERHPGLANTCVLGFMAGSMMGIFAQSVYIADPTFNWLIGGIVLAAGLGLSVLFLVLGKSMGKLSDG
ncbi:MAG: DUF368 domain-containing protein [Oscillospiraceae bacterium]|nr:DUF368 domain-containing protein [Oscillospiraceae bacterium]